MKKLSIFAVAAFACLCLIGVMSGEVFADGTEALGVPSIPIESGSGIVAAGVGLANTQPGTITITVPGSTVKQVLLYWEGSMATKTDDPDDYRTITVNANSITGDLIGGPYHPFPSTLNNWNGLAFRADITNLGLVDPGFNELIVSDVLFDDVANGAGVLVIYEDASLGAVEISIRDGHDFAFINYNSLLNVTAPQTFKFPKSVNSRTANLNMFFTTVEGEHSSGVPDVFRPTAIVIKDNISSSPVWYDNLLYSNSGEEWDTFVLPAVSIPADATSLTIQAYSWDRLNLFPYKVPASLVWIAAALSMPLELCSIGDFVWYDDNNDGIQDALESGIDDVLVRLYNCSNLLVGTTSTTNGGKYKFTDLVPGDYYLEFIAPYGYTFSPQDQDSDALDSDADPVTGKTVCTTLEAGENDITWDAGLIVEEKCGPCKDKITELTLQYNGLTAANIKVVQKKDSVEIFEDIVQPGELFTFVGEDKNGTMGTEIKIYVDGDENTKIHTSCSQPIGPGLISGDFVVIEGYSLEGGLLCPTDEDDDCECDGKVTELTLQNNGTGATIKVVQKKDNIEIFNQFVNAGGEFTFVGQDKNGTMGTEIIIYVGVVENTKIHTSCSKPIGPGLKSGDFLVIEGESLKGGPLCPMP